MRVLVVGAAADSSIFDVERGWVTALERAGHDVYLYSLRNRLKYHTEVLAWRREGLKCPNCAHELVRPNPEAPQVGLSTVMQAASECVVHEAIRFEAQMILVVSGCSFHPNALAFCNRLGIPVATALTESPYNDEDMGDLARMSAVVGTNERTSVPFFSGLAGQAALYLPTAYDVTRHVPGKAFASRQSDVFFCGTGFDERAELFAETDWEGVDFKLAGFWPTRREDEVHPDEYEGRHGQVKIGSRPELGKYLAGGVMDNDEVLKWYRSAQVVLQLHRSDGRSESIGPRIYEAAAVGAFQLADDSRPELGEIFGRSVPTFPANDHEQLAWAVRYWLGRPGRRQELAELARERVRGHSYDDRLSTLVQCLREL